jgi:ABC-type transport system substrate-binding protein
MIALPNPCTSVPLSTADFNSSLALLGVDAATAWTILQVESGKSGFLPDRRPQILFERAVFHTRTKGAWDGSNPNVSAPTWGGYSGGAAEYGRLAEAYALSADDALQSASWGIAQMMGFNFSPAGYQSASDFVQSSCASESAQLQAFVSFLQHTGIATSLQAHDWVSVARKYNGGGNVAVYSAKLQAGYAALQDPAALPDINVRAAQSYLAYLANLTGTPSYSPGGIDGILGSPGKSKTLAALTAFQAAQNLPATNAIDDEVLAALANALPAASNLALG